MVKLDESIKLFRKEVFVDELGFKLEDEFDVDEEKYFHCCIYEKDELIAYARVFIEQDKARIGRVSVKKDKRGKGCGKQIMLRAETEVLKRGVENVEVHAVKNAIGFYEKLGYTAVGKEFEEEGKPHLLMIKRLGLDT